MMRNEILDQVPGGWRKTEGTNTEPVGCSWYNNGESRFSGKRKSVLVMIDKKLFLEKYKNSSKGEQ